MLELYGYQRDAIQKMKNGCILCGDVGSGKSRTALAFYFFENGGELLDYGEDRYIPMEDPPQDLYIITTARKRDTKEWEGELSPFLLSTNKEVSLYTNKVVIDSWNNIGKYMDVKNAFFIFDEQRVIGSGAWVKSFLKITKANGWILLSATPGDKWEDYIPVFIANGFYKNRSQFIREHVVYAPRVKFPKVDRYLNTGRLIRLRNKILVDMNFKRNTISHDIDVLCKYDVTQYRRVARDRWNIWEDRPLTGGSELCVTLRKIVNSDSSRGEAILDTLREKPKVIIFYNFDYELDILRGLLYSDGTEIAEWNGHKHQPIPDGDKWVYLVQYTAGCEGWNCIKTDTIIFYSPNYSYRIMKQAKGRIDRLITPYTDLYYYFLYSHAPIDISIRACLARKKDFNAGAYGNRMLKRLEIAKNSDI